MVEITRLDVKEVLGEAKSRTFMSFLNRKVQGKMKMTKVVGGNKYGANVSLKPLLHYNVEDTIRAIEAHINSIGYIDHTGHRKRLIAHHNNAIETLKLFKDL